MTFGSATAANTIATFSVDGIYVLRLTVSDGALSAHRRHAGDRTACRHAACSPRRRSTRRCRLRFGRELSEFLHTGPGAPQTGVAPGTIEPRRVAVLRGRAIDREGAPLAGVTVKVHGRAQFGQVLTRADGRYEMAVNGGEVLTVDYAKAGLLPAQRTVRVPWRDYVNVVDVAMIPVDAAVTAIAGNGGAMQVHRATAQTDADGTRRTTLLLSRAPRRTDGAPRRRHPTAAGAQRACDRIHGRHEQSHRDAGRPAADERVHVCGRALGGRGHDRGCHQRAVQPAGTRVPRELPRDARGYEGAGRLLRPRRRALGRRAGWNRDRCRRHPAAVSRASTSPAMAWRTIPSPPSRRSASRSRSGRRWPGSTRRDKACGACRPSTSPRGTSIGPLGAARRCGVPERAEPPPSTRRSSGAWRKRRSPRSWSARTRRSGNRSPWWARRSRSTTAATAWSIAIARSPWTFPLSGASVPESLKRIDVQRRDRGPEGHAVAPAREQPERHVPLGRQGRVRPPDAGPSGSHRIRKLHLRSAVHAPSPRGGGGVRPAG